MPLLDYLILWHKPNTNNSIEYGEKILEFFKGSGISRSQSKARGYYEIQSFLDSVMRSLRLEGSCSVQLVFTHGDFCPANMLNTKNGIRVIDWEGAKYRSALFDFYHYFFYRPVSKKTSIPQVASEINEALPIVISSLASKSLSISRSLDQLANIYRWTYYIEEIWQMVEREMTDKNLEIVELTLQYIEAFNRYEKALVIGGE
jgi:thiamine kinase-like enzyme